ncbi:putative concanavalin A-like glucanase [Chloropicon primus]|uniref:Putative concanavalin A-like glucanase n=1 Tax=Chloropicon primus TaxID=1764295 RepID=A0A5B8MD41_9CHLO|nr:putative concanavalin A-like glucanase [Chloropicon primus]UPQ96744.1 putative concanavalin A-like glucanase [Chloropicon primus]|eukprot:QDZ17525.1 putative concanavalin A-like glucanase [Chloropicon primus]
MKGRSGGGTTLRSWRFAYLAVVLLVSQTVAPARGQWGFPAVQTGFPIPAQAQWDAAVNWYWQSFLGGLESFAAPPGEHPQQPAGHGGGERPKLNLGDGDDGGEEEWGVDGETRGGGGASLVDFLGGVPSPFSPGRGFAVVEEVEEEVLESARLHVVQLLLNLTMDTVSEMGGGADAQAIAYDYDDDDDSAVEGAEEPLVASEILSKVYDKILNQTSSPLQEESLVSFSEFVMSRNVTEDNIRVIRAIERLPKELQSVIKTLNQTLTDVGLPTANGNSNVDLTSEGGEAAGRLEKSFGRIDPGRKNTSSSISGSIDYNQQCILQDLMREEKSCLGHALENQEEVCFVSIISEALRESVFWKKKIEESTFSVLFLPSDTAILKMLKFAQVSPRVVLKKERMREVINRHSVVYKLDEFRENPFGKIGIGKLLETNLGSRHTVMELPSGGRTNAPNVTFIMERKDDGSSSLYIATKKPACLLKEYYVEEAVARFYHVAKEDCMTDYLEFCTDPSYDGSTVPGLNWQNSGVTENPCGIAQLLGVKLCSDGIILPINNLLFDSEQTANFIALLSGATHMGSTREKVPAYNWPLTDAPPYGTSKRVGNSSYKLVGTVSRSEFLDSGVTLGRKSFLQIPEVKLNEGEGTTICFSVTSPTARLDSTLLRGLSNKWNFTISAKAENDVSKLRFETGPVGYTSTLVLQDNIDNNIAIAVDDKEGLWYFYENGWLVDRKGGMPQLPNFQGEMWIGGDTASSSELRGENLEGSIKNVKIFEEVLSPEDIARFCKGSEAEVEDGEEVEVTPRADTDAIVADGPSGSFDLGAGGAVCTNLSEHLKAMSNLTEEVHAGVRVRKASLPVIPQYYYPLTLNGTNSGAYGPSSYAVGNGGLDSDSFTPNGVHFDGKDQYLLISDVGLTGNNFSMGFTFSLDTYSRIHQTMFQLISQCQELPLDLYIQLKLNSEITGEGNDILSIVINGEVSPIEIDKVQIRKPLSIVLVFEGKKLTLYMGRGDSGDGFVSTARLSQAIPPTFGKARVGSTNSFAGVVKDLFLYDNVLREDDIASLL